MSIKPRDRVKLDQLIRDDSARALQRFPSDAIPLTVTSPPYSDMRDYDGSFWNFKWVALELYRITAPGGVLVWIASDECRDARQAGVMRPGKTGETARQQVHFQDIGFTLHDVNYALYPNKLPRQKYRHEQCVDTVLVFCKGDRPTTANIRRVPCENAGKEVTLRAGHSYDQIGVFRDRGGPRKKVRINETKNDCNYRYYTTGRGQTSGDDEAADHPAPFSEQLAADQIESWSQPGDVVLDPFCGSGTTLKMAKLANRYWIGIDVVPEYIEMSRQRLNFQHRRDGTDFDRGGRALWLESRVQPRTVSIVVATPKKRTADAAAEFDWKTDEPTCTVLQAAQACHRTVDAIRMLISRKRLPARRSGREWRVPLRALDSIRPPNAPRKNSVRAEPGPDPLLSAGGDEPPYSFSDSLSCGGGPPATAPPAVTPPAAAAGG